MKLELTTDLYVREDVVDGTMLTTPEQVHTFLKEMEHMVQEAFVVILMNTKNKVIKKEIISLGTVNSSLVHPRETFRPAIMAGASAIILAHNHPSGDPTPSSEDIKITKQLIAAGEVIGIKILDHVIIGTTSLSLRETGFVRF